MGGELGAIHGGSIGDFLEEAVEGLFGGAVRGLWRFMELRASQKNFRYI